MKFLQTASGVCGLLSAVVPSVAQAAASAEGTLAAFHASLHQGDRAGALSTLSDNVRIFEQGWVEQSKVDYASHHLDSDISFAKVVSTHTTDVDILSDDAMAVVMSQSHSKGTFDGKPVDSIGIETVVLHKVDGDWKIVHIHWSSRKAE